MKTKLFYFTGTGNTLAVARDLAAELGDAELVPITRGFDHGPLLKDVRIGIVYPVYDWGLPAIVHDFAGRLTAAGDSYIFGVAVYGAMLARSLHVLRDVLARRQLRLAAGFGVRMPGNFIPLYNVVAEEKQKKMFAAEKVKVKEIAAAVRAGASRAPESNLGLFGAFLTGFAYPKMLPKIPDGDREFRVDERCDGCGTCARVCPVKNLAMQGGKPVWNHRCEVCLSCFHWCPRQAIQSGKKSAQRGRYHHPEVTLNDVLR